MYQISENLSTYHQCTLDIAVLNTKLKERKNQYAAITKSRADAQARTKLALSAVLTEMELLPEDERILMTVDNVVYVQHIKPGRRKVVKGLNPDQTTKLENELIDNALSMEPGIITSMIFGNEEPCTVVTLKKQATAKSKTKAQ
jgi:chaperonin cofactor prefoldin